MEKRLYEREEKLELMELEVKSAQRQLRELEKQSKKEVSCEPLLCNDIWLIPVQMYVYDL
jgi:hypothetical protein